MLSFLPSIICLVFVLTNNAGCSSVEWSYTKEDTKPHHWSQLKNTMCGGFWQSPVNIQLILTEHITLLKPVRIFRSALAPPGVCKLYNSGHTIGIQFPPDTWYVSFDGTDSRDYEMVQMHFHWGEIDSLGSEHSFDGRRFPLEGHIVSYRKGMYPNATIAMESPGGLAVLGILYELSNETVPSKTHIGLLGNMTEILENPIDIETLYPMPEVDLTRLFGQLDTGKYFRYEGSLTTPPCTENVMWTVFESPVPVTPDQLRMLREQKFRHSEIAPTMANNFRPTQPLNARDAPIFRKIYRSSATRLYFSGLHSVLFLIFSYLYNHS